MQQLKYRESLIGFVMAIKLLLSHFASNYLHDMSLLMNE